MFEKGSQHFGLDEAGMLTRQYYPNPKRRAILKEWGFPKSGVWCQWRHTRLGVEVYLPKACHLSCWKVVLESLLPPRPKTKQQKTFPEECQALAAFMKVTKRMKEEREQQLGTRECVCAHLFGTFGA